MLSEKDFKKEIIIDIAKKMAIAARTAPKGKGLSNLEIKIAFDSDIELIANKMVEISQKHNQKFFERDAQNILNSDAVILLGVKFNSLKLEYCGLCGFNDCKEREKNNQHPCSFNNIELGIALGSAASIAADNRVDSRIMYTAGMAARELNLFNKEFKIIMAIAISANDKNIYFDRK